MPKRTNNIKVTDRNTPWNKQRTKRKPYKIESEDKAQTFLIICEGENTEP